MIKVSLEGKNALVTGCNKGIGKAMAEGLAEAGADIIGVSATMPSEGSDIQLAVESLGRKFYTFQADFSDRKSIYSFLAISYLGVKNSHDMILPLTKNLT